MPEEIIDELRKNLDNDYSKIHQVETNLNIWLRTFINERDQEGAIFGVEVSLFGLALLRRTVLFSQGVAEYRLLKSLGEIKGINGAIQTLRRIGFSQRQLAADFFKRADILKGQVQFIEMNAQLIASMNGLGRERFWEFDKRLEEIASGGGPWHEAPLLNFIAGKPIGQGTGAYLSLYKGSLAPGKRLAFQEEDEGGFVVGDGFKAYESHQWQPEEEIPYAA